MLEFPVQNCAGGHETVNAANKRNRRCIVREHLLSAKERNRRISFYGLLTIRKEQYKQHKLYKGLSCLLHLKGYLKACRHNT
jgi:hypothetical protein